MRLPRLNWTPSWRWGVDEKYPTESGDGGAIFIGNGATGTIQNCAFLNNHTPIQEFGDDGGAINISGHIKIQGGSASAITPGTTLIANRCIFLNGNAADNTQRPDEETGSIMDDPLLDVNLIPGVGSPAIDAGVDPAAFGVTLTTDYDGIARPQGAAYDIGAIEAVPEPPVE